MGNWANLHILSFFKETLYLNVSLQKKTVINNLGEKMCKYNNIFRGSAVLKVSFKKKESRRQFKIFKIFGVDFLKTENMKFWDGSLVLKSDQM